MEMKNLYYNYTVFEIKVLMVQELWCMEYFFPMSSGISLYWMLLTLEHHSEGSDNGLSSRKLFGIFHPMLTSSFC